MSGHLPIVAEPHQRYWRRRANRRVRKARLTRTALRWSAVLLINGVIAGTLLTVGVRSVKRIAARPEFMLDTIEVLGTQRASSIEVERALHGYLGRNVFDLNLHQVKMRVRDHRWVQDASVKRILPATLRVTVSERTPAALAVVGGLAHVVDDTGFVIGLAEGGLADDLPVLTGLGGLDDSSLIASLQRGVGLLQRLHQRAGAFAGDISEMEISRPDRVTVRTVARGPQLLLDPVAVERNVVEYLELREKIEERLGAADYVDLRWNDRVSVMPGIRRSQEGGS